MASNRNRTLLYRLVQRGASSRMLKKSASGVLVSLRGSTYRSVRLASSLTAALLDSLFEHPEPFSTSASYGDSHGIVCMN